MSTGVHLRLLEYAELVEVYTSDASLFPNALTLDHLMAWYDSAPDFFLACSVDDDTDAWVGCLVALPLPLSTWRCLVSGDLEEHAIPSLVVADAARAYHAGFTASLAIHFWHVERFASWSSCTSERFSATMTKYIQSLQDKGVRKFSALTATLQGQNLFSRLAFIQCGTFDYLCMHPQKGLYVHHVTKDDQAQQDFNSSKVLWECKMMILECE